MNYIDKNINIMMLKITCEELCGCVCKMTNAWFLDEEDLEIGKNISYCAGL